MMTKDNTQRFSSRVDNYIKYRPTYPTQLIDYLVTDVGINEESIVADLGAGTGIFTELLIPKAKKVLAVEPNDAMRFAAEALLNQYDNFYSINGSAEQTNIEDNSIDFITMAQAYHWIDSAKGLKEFQRIAKPSAILILVWNNRIDNTDFLLAYEDILQNYASDYKEVNHQNLTEDEIGFCFEGRVIKRVFTNQQLFDYAGLLGRVKSSSYVPEEDSPQFRKLESELQMAFANYNENNQVAFNYHTEIYWGRLKQK